MAGAMSGQSIVVTGASRGLGRVLVKSLIEEGAQVVCAARNRARLKALCEPLGENAVDVEADLGVPADVERVFRTAEERFGKVDVLINNAAIYDFFLIENASPERICATVNANLLAPMLCTRAAIPLMRKTGAGDIINVSSEGVRIPFAYLTAYAATKAGLESFSGGMRTELRPDNIRVTTLRLGAMDDPAREVTMDEETYRGFFERNVGAMAAAGKTLMPFEKVARAIIDMLTLPEELAFDLVELRPRT
jgi:NAD(P)-dependent dehydrogenase (short-subunit alcohol dehydrogenase family)